MGNGVLKDRQRDGKVLQLGDQYSVLEDIALEQVTHALHRANEGNQAMARLNRPAQASARVRARMKLLSRRERVVGRHAPDATARREPNWLIPLMRTICMRDDDGRSRRWEGFAGRMRPSPDVQVAVLHRCTRLEWFDA